MSDSVTITILAIVSAYLMVDMSWLHIVKHFGF